MRASVAQEAVAALASSMDEEKLVVRVDGQSFTARAVSVGTKRHVAEQHAARERDRVANEDKFVNMQAELARVTRDLEQVKRQPVNVAVNRVDNSLNVSMQSQALATQPATAHAQQQQQGANNQPPRRTRAC